MVQFLWIRVCMFVGEGVGAPPRFLFFGSRLVDYRTVRRQELVL